MNTVYPELPDDKFLDHDQSDIELTFLWYDLVVELADERYRGRTHHNPRTYDAGCKGPLCLKSVRLRTRKRMQTATHEKFIWTEPILDYWWPIASERIDDLRAKIVKELTT